MIKCICKSDMKKKKKNIFKRIIHRSLSCFFRSLSRLLCSLGIVKPKVIVYMDGGICSQMHQYLCGQTFDQKSIDVMYDTLWFVESGKDLDGRFDRKLELQEMFPELSFHTLTSRQSKFYRYCFSWREKGPVLPAPQNIKRNTYLAGWYHLYPTEDFKDLFQDCFGANRQFDIPVHITRADGITNCAVPVRRGDLVNRTAAFYEANPWYRPLPEEYFFNTIQYVKGHYPNVQFYFFSDEIDWVENNLLSQIDSPCHLVCGNKAYVDLALIAECDVVIGSHGSFGEMGARLNGHSDVIVPSSDSDLGFEIKNFSKKAF